MTDPLAGLDLALLLAFEAIAAERNITRAARRLGITQPAMSARVARLRRLFDDALFVPADDARGVMPTPRAEALAEEIAAALARLRRLTDVAAPFDPAASDRVFTLAMHDNPAMMLVPALIGRVRSRAPGIRIVVVLPDGDTIGADLASGAIDLLVGRPDLSRAQWLTRPLLADGFVTAQRRHHPRGDGPIDLDAFCALDHLLVSAAGGGLSGTVDDALAAVGRRRRVAASIQSYALAPLVVEASDLVCTLPRRLLAGSEDRLDLFDPPLALGTFALAAYWHERSRRDQGLAWLRAELLAVAEGLTSR